MKVLIKDVCLFQSLRKACRLKYSSSFAQNAKNGFIFVRTWCYRNSVGLDVEVHSILKLDAVLVGGNFVIGFITF